MLALLLKNELYKAALKQKLNHPFYFSVLWCFYPVFASLIELVKLFLSFSASPMFSDEFVFVVFAQQMYLGMQDGKMGSNLNMVVSQLRFSSSVICVNSQLVGLPPVGILMLRLFELFVN